MTVLDLIAARDEIYVLKEDATVHEAARYLRDRQVRAVGVVAADGRLAGVVSQSDISDKVAAENKCPAWMRVSEIMSTGLVTVAPDRPVADCLRLMEQHGFYHLLVVEADGSYRGMVSMRDLLAVIASNEKSRADMLEAFAFDRTTAS
jgi:CBS domain-containing protein